MSGIFSNGKPTDQSALARLMFEMGYIKAVVIEIRDLIHMRGSATSTATPSTAPASKDVLARTKEFLALSVTLAKLAELVRAHWGKLISGAGLLIQWVWPLLQRLLLGA